MWWISRWKSPETCFTSKLQQFPILRWFLGGPVAILQLLRALHLHGKSHPLNDRLRLTNRFYYELSAIAVSRPSRLPVPLPFILAPITPCSAGALACMLNLVRTSYMSRSRPLAASHASAKSLRLSVNGGEAQLLLQSTSLHAHSWRRLEQITVDLTTS